jgi:hypothetical protein
MVHISEETALDVHHLLDQSSDGRDVRRQGWGKHL